MRIVSFAGLVILMACVSVILTPQTATAPALTHRIASMNAQGEWPVSAPQWPGDLINVAVYRNGLRICAECGDYRISWLRQPDDPAGVITIIPAKSWDAGDTVLVEWIQLQ
jgi:hypothetical protein